MGEMPDHLLVLYASQTGNAMDAAERVGREAERGGCPCVAVLSMYNFDPCSLPDEQTVIFIVSTTGQGDPPDSMKFAAKKLDKRLSDLGAKSIVEKGLGDDQHPSGYEGAFDPWLVSLWNMLNQIKPEILPRVSDIQGVRILDNAKLQISYHCVDATQQQFPSSPDLNSLEKVIETTRLMSPALHQYGDNWTHCFLRMITNQRLTEAGDRDVRHFEFEAVSSGLRYQTGDVLEILPRQNSIVVDSFIRRCNLDPDCYITVHPRANKKQSYGYHPNGLSNSVRLKTFVEWTMDVASASPDGLAVKQSSMNELTNFMSINVIHIVMSFFATAEHDKERLQYFSSSEGRDDLHQNNQKERRTVLEVLEDFPSVHMPFEWLVQLVPPLKTRAFSISSSPLAHPNQVHLTVSKVSWSTPFKRKRHGLCSSWLAGIDPQNSKGISTKISVKCRNLLNFRHMTQILPVTNRFRNFINK